MKKVTLEELKETTRQHMDKELDIMEMMFYLDDNDAKKFQQWYINLPYVKGIREIQKLVKQRGKSNSRNKDTLHKNIQ